MDLSEDGARHGMAGASASRAYELVRRELLSEFREEFFRAYVEPMTLVAEEDGALLFRAGSAIAQERLRMQVQPRLEARMSAHLQRPVTAKILVEREIPERVRALIEARAVEARPAVAAEAEGAAPAAGPPAHPQSFTFDTFCIDQSNFRAVTVARMIAQGAAGALFPVWLVHSPPGCGKTHLLNAVAHEFNWRMADRHALLITGQEFLESFQSALHKKRDSAGFKDMVRSPDLLLIDDFQRLIGKKATEEEALDTIGDLTKRGRQVVIAADHGAASLEGLDERLRARLRGAASCEILEPGRELRRRILEERVRHYARVTPGFAVAPEALDFIAERMPVSGRELDGAVSQLVIEAKISGGTEVGVDAAMGALQGKLSEASDRRITVLAVQKVVARHYGMTVQQLLERTRRHAVARPRQVAMYLATKLTHASLPDIGARFGGFDHTTIMYARDRIADLMRDDPKIRAEVESIDRLVRREP